MNEIGNLRATDGLFRGSGGRGSLIVISAINIFKGGSLTIAREFLAHLDGAISKADASIVVFCHSKQLYDGLNSRNVVWIEKPWSRKNWLCRLFYEYIWFWFWSRDKDVDCWVSLHDITPNVKAKRRYVYCHNPAAFYTGKTVWRYEPSFELFRLFYAFLYQINIHKNDGVILQQGWLRNAFLKKYGLHLSKVIVALPETKLIALQKVGVEVSGRSLTTVIFPAVPRPFKNIEVLLRAMALLSDYPITLVVTITGTENKYARDMRARAGSSKNVEFAGYLDQTKLSLLYDHAHAMVFPSKLETWGLPMTEFKSLGRPIIAAALPYAYETLSGYSNGYFFPPDDHVQLAALLRNLCENSLPAPPRLAKVSYDEPIARNWGELLEWMNLKPAGGRSSHDSF